MTIKLQEMINHTSPNYPLEMNTIINGGRDGLCGPHNCSGCMYQWCGGCMNVPQICWLLHLHKDWINWSGRPTAATIVMWKLWLLKWEGSVPAAAVRRLSVRDSASRVRLSPVCQLNSGWSCNMWSWILTTVSLPGLELCVILIIETDPFWSRVTDICSWSLRCPLKDIIVGWSCARMKWSILPLSRSCRRPTWMQPTISACQSS